MSGHRDDATAEGAYTTARCVAFLIRAKIFVWMQDEAYNLVGSRQVYAIQAVNYINLIMTACAYELLLQAGLEKSDVDEIINESDKVDTNNSLLMLNEALRSRGLGIDAARAGAGLHHAPADLVAEAERQRLVRPDAVVEEAEVGVADAATGDLDEDVPGGGVLQLERLLHERLPDGLHHPAVRRHGDLLVRAAPALRGPS